MARPQIFEGTPDELTEHLGVLPKAQRYRVTIVAEDSDGSALSDEEIASADAALEKTIVSSDHATGTDNEVIDADLALEYGGTKIPVDQRDER